jgi:hypothetical protein
VLTRIGRVHLVHGVNARWLRSLSDVVDQHKTLHRSLAYDLALALKLCQKRRNHRLEVNRTWRTPVSGEERYGVTECSMCGALAFAS